jgi:hypothetical protein
VTRIKPKLKAPVQSPEQQRRTELIQAHVDRVLQAADKSEIPIPKATRARVITQQTIDYLNRRLYGVKTVDKRVKEDIAKAIVVIKQSFAENQVPLPTSIMDSWVGGRVHLRLTFKKSDDLQMAIEQLQALPPADDETAKAIEETIAGFRREKH